jgi:uncharacterized protein (TIRG00374 family)
MGIPPSALRRAAPSLALFAVLGVVTLVHGDVIAETIRRSGDIPLFTLVGLFLAAACLAASRGYLLSVVTPGITVGQGVKADQSALAAAYAIAFGGGALGVAAKVTMFRSWAVSLDATAVSLVATAVLPTLSTWTPAVFVHLPMVADGSATQAETLAVIVGIGALVFNVGFWALVLYTHAPARTIARIFERSQGFALRKVPSRFSRLHASIEQADPHRFTGSVKDGLRRLLRTRGFRMALGTVLVPCVSFTSLLLALRAYDVTEVSVIEALSAFALVRVIVSLSPLPGGVGLAELGLVALLTDAGASEVGATGATILYRAVTWLSPMIIGAVSWWLWKRSHTATTKGHDHGALRHPNSLSEVA